MKRLQPGQLHTELNIGTVLLEMGQADMALKYFESLQSRYPQAIEINQRMAEAYYRQKEYQKAIVQYEFVIDRAPRFIESYVQLGWVHYKVGNVAKAIEVTQRGLQANPQANRLSTLSYMNLGFYSVLDRTIQGGREMVPEGIGRRRPERGRCNDRGLERRLQKLSRHS